MRMQVGPPHVGVARLKCMMFQLLQRLVGLQDLPSGNDSGEAGYQAYSGYFPCTSYLPLLYSARYG